MRPLPALLATAGLLLVSPATRVLNCKARSERRPRLLWHEYRG